jgi:hypothetical protein
MFCRAEELRILRGEQEVDEANLRLGDLDDDDDDDDGDDISQPSDDQVSLLTGNMTSLVKSQHRRASCSFLTVWYQAVGPCRCCVSAQHYVKIQHGVGLRGEKCSIR